MSLTAGRLPIQCPALIHGSSFVFAQKHMDHQACSSGQHHANDAVKLPELYGQRKSFLCYLINMAFNELLFLCSTRISQQHHRRLRLSDTLQEVGKARLSD